ncbi:MAG TPA: sigma-70 family RNA polymerase sigma factor [Solirubrobacterales bacterium]|nr:sigma-70 family RNA polymerase sigma factor [Solirubrobacterales bacterium]
MSAMAEALPPFQAFLDEHLESVRAFLRGMVGPTDAEDCLQETFLAALRAYRRAEPANLRAWVLTIARHKAIDHHRSRARATPVPDPEELIDRREGAQRPPDGALGMSPRHSEVWAAVAELPPGQRAAVVLRFAVDLRYREVGEALGTSEEAARRNVHEALKKLRASARDLKEMAR